MIAGVVLVVSRLREVRSPPLLKSALKKTTQLTTPGDADAVFLLRSGATLRNVIIGKNQAEGVHCDGPCTLEFVWFEDVCEDAITVKNDKAGQETWIIGGGAYHASDKVVQHNGCGTVNIINFYVEDYGKLYRSCGNVSPPSPSLTITISCVCFGFLFFY